MPITVEHVVSLFVRRANFSKRLKRPVPKPRVEPRGHCVKPQCCCRRFNGEPSGTGASPIRPSIAHRIGLAGRNHFGLSRHQPWKAAQAELSAQCKCRCAVPAIPSIANDAVTIVGVARPPSCTGSRLCSICRPKDGHSIAGNIRWAIPSIVRPLNRSVTIEPIHPQLTCFPFMDRGEAFAIRDIHFQGNANLS